MNFRWQKFLILPTITLLPFANNLIACQKNKVGSITFFGSDLVNGFRYEDKIVITYENFELDGSSYGLDAYKVEVLSSEIDDLKGEIIPIDDKHFNVQITIENNIAFLMGSYNLSVIIYNDIAFKSLFNQLLKFQVDPTLIFPKKFDSFHAAFIDGKFKGICQGFILRNSVEPRKYGFSISSSSPKLGEVSLDYFIQESINGDYYFDLILNTSATSLLPEDLDYVTLSIPGYEQSTIIMSVTPCAETFQKDTWENINIWSSQGIDLLKKRYYDDISLTDTFVGLKKALIINGIKYEVMVVGEEHDELVDIPTRKATLTFMFCQQLSSTETPLPIKLNYGYVNPETNELRWSNSVIREYLSSFKFSIDQAMGCLEGESFLKNVSKETGIGYDGSLDCETTTELLWCPSAIEVGAGNSYDKAQVEGEPYSYFADIQSPEKSDQRIITFFDEKQYGYWLRSTGKLWDDAAIGVNPDGSLSTIKADESQSQLVPFFCI